MGSDSRSPTVYKRDPSFPSISTIINSIRHDFETKTSNNPITQFQDSSSPNSIQINMHFSTISAAAIAALAFLATPAVGAAMPTADLAARSTELEARAEQLEARAAALVCQFGGVKACSVRVSTDVPHNGNAGKISNHINSALPKDISMAATAAPL
ncbi:MAG: hypothetical protein Q9180_005496, partial [Flavoplaca navasiana]